MWYTLQCTRVHHLPRYTQTCHVSSSSSLFFPTNRLLTLSFIANKVSFPPLILSGCPLGFMSLNIQEVFFFSSQALILAHSLAVSSLWSLSRLFSKLSTGRNFASLASENGGVSGGVHCCWAFLKKRKHMLGCWDAVWRGFKTKAKQKMAF